MFNTYISIKIRLLGRKNKVFKSDLTLTGRGGTNVYFPALCKFSEP